MIKFFKQLFCKHWWVRFYKGGDVVIKKCVKCEKTRVEKLTNFIKHYERRYNKR